MLRLMRSHSACVRLSPCFILMFEGWLTKSIWMDSLSGVDSILKSSSGEVLGLGDGADDSGEELDESE